MSHGKMNKRREEERVGGRKKGRGGGVKEGEREG